MTQDLAERVTRLERENRNLWRMTIGAGLIVAVVLVARQVGLSKDLELVSAQAFHLVDDAGNVRGSWDLGEHGQNLRLKGPDGLSGISMGVGPGKRVSLSMSDIAGFPRVLLILKDDEGSEGTSLDFRGRDSKVRVGIGVLKVGGGHMADIECFDAAGNRRGSFGLIEQSEGTECRLTLLDEEEKERAIISYVEETGNTEITLKRSDDEVEWSAP